MILKKRFCFYTKEKPFPVGLFPILTNIMTFGENTNDLPKEMNLFKYWNYTVNYTAINTDEPQEVNIPPILLWNCKTRN